MGTAWSGDLHRKHKPLNLQRAFLWPSKPHLKYLPELAQNLSNEVLDLFLRTTLVHPSSPEARLSQYPGKKKLGAGGELSTNDADLNGEDKMENLEPTG